MTESVERPARPENMNTLPLHERLTILDQVKEQLKDDVQDEKFVYVGPGAETRYGVSNGRLRLVYTLLREEEGYSTHLLKLPHPDPDIDEDVVVKVLTKNDVSYQETWANRDKILKLWLNAQPAKN